MISIPKRLGILRSKSSTSFRGGTQIQDDVVMSLMKSHKVEVFEFSLESPIPHFELGDWVYTQQEGGLSQNYRSFAEELLSRHVNIFEKNVFALPSKYRPVHPNYFMLLMSEDGANRFTIRNAGHFLKDPTDTFILSPNLLRDLGPRSTQRVPIDFNNEITLLKIARPDKRKWTNFEVEFSRALAMAMPSQKFHLRLVGYPWEMPFVPENLRISIDSFQEKVEHSYLKSDVYIHESQIGESFGNTLFEARYFNMPIILALATKWDCAPLEYLENSAVIKTRKKLMDDPVENLNKAIKISGNLNEVDPGKANLFKLIFNESYSTQKLVRPLPRLRDALGYIYSTSKKLEESFGMMSKSVILEFVRTWKRDITQL